MQNIIMYKCNLAFKSKETFSGEKSGQFATDKFSNI